MCQLKLQSSQFGNLILRTCPGFNHLFTFGLNPKQPYFLKLSLGSGTLTLDFHNQISTFTQDNFTLQIPKLLTPDFPSLTNLKETLDFYAVFS